MRVIHLPARQVRALAPIHPTTPRAGVFAMPRRARSTGPQAHLHTYVADEERACWRQVGAALARCGMIAAGIAVGVIVHRALGGSL